MFRKSVLGRVLSALITIAIATGQGLAQIGDASLRVSVTDPNGAAIVAAHVVVSVSGTKKRTLETGQQGEVSLTSLAPGKCKISVEAAGFQRREIDAVLKAGLNQVQVQMEIAHIEQEMLITTDIREKLTDPRGNAFTTVLTEEQIALLPDDPEEFAAAIRQMAGPGAIIRVNGFAGGRLPPKSQIREIRFRLNPYAAENHAASMIGVDIYTKPGADTWRGTFNFGFRDGALGARNAFAPVRGPEQYRRFGLAMDGPIWANHTSLFLSADGTDSFDSKTIVAALPDGPFSDLVRRPSRVLNLSARVEHILTKSHTLRFEYQRNGSRQDNLGAGDFDLPDRAYSSRQTEHIFRFSDTGMLTNKLVNELRFQTRWQNTESSSAAHSAAVIVLNAFSSGGAQIQSSRHIRDIELVDNVDIAFGRHSIKAGLSIEAKTYDTLELRNADGTFIFANLDSFHAARPTTFSKRTGDPLVAFTQYELGWYLQDDMRLTKGLTLSLGVRQEQQSHLADHNNFAPRVGLAWSPFASGSTVIRAGAGVFYSWFDADYFEQTLRVDGQRQRDIVVRNPGFPDPLSGGAQIILPPSRIQSDPGMNMPYAGQASLGVERQVGKKFQVRANYFYQRGVHLLRGHNVNAPQPGLGRPDPAAGNIVQIESTAGSTGHTLNLNLNPGGFSRRFYWIVNYSLSKTVNDADSPLSLPANNLDLRAERGPSLLDMRHRFFAIVNLAIVKEVRLGTFFHANSATPYNITTGFDDNGDTASNDRPAGVGRNSARGKPQWDVSMRLSWSFGFGKASDAASKGGRPTVVRSRGDVDALGALSPDSANKRYRMQFYVQAYNLFNHPNLMNFTGVQTSPFFGHATAALPGRRMEAGTRFSF
ncbi:MAG: TonB-dependent receptor [Acidobacteriota bacterium]